MIGLSSLWTFGLKAYLLVGLLAYAARAEPDAARCPDYVATYAPLLWLHSDDPFMPSDILAHVQHTTPEVNGKLLEDLPPLDLDNLDILNEQPGEVFLTSKDDPLTFPEWFKGEAPDEAGQIHNSTPCVVVTIEHSPQELDVFYFYFYSFNDGANVSQVMEPFDRFVDPEGAAKGLRFGNHVGDWEHNMIRFRDGKPVGIFYSQHIDGMAYDWDHSAISKSDGRPIVYSARGSHANYPAPGKQVHNAALIDLCDEGQRWDPVLSAYFYHFDPETFTLTTLLPPNNTSPLPPSSNQTSFFYFTGRWGDRFPDSDPRQMVDANFGVKRFDPGPQGPRFKDLVRKGLAPDHPRTMGWIEWAVTIFMWWYPCCIRGWRIWVSGAIIISLFIGVVFGIIYGVRKYRQRKMGRTDYRQLQEEGIPLDEWHDEEESLFSSSDDDD